MHQNIPMFYNKTWGCFYNSPYIINEQKQCEEKGEIMRFMSFK